MTKKICELLNIQINKELESAYLYLSMFNHFAEKGLMGFAHWYKMQAYEEIEHANKFIDYLHENNMKVELEDIDIIDYDFDGNMDALSKGLQHERYITSLINNIYKTASAEEDYRTMNFLDWFIKEQAEEEINAQDLIDKYNIYGCESGGGLFELNKELSQRA